MARLSPCPFGALVTRMFREHEARQRIFDLPAASFVLGDPALDVSVRFHGRTVASPFGPAAGPHTQLAQNIVLSWLAGGRIIELKTVQQNDQLEVPRPCIDVRTIGFNVEWSQELRLEESLEEYVKASMLIEMLVASGRLPLAPGFDRFVFDMSVGYDFAGITSERVRAFMNGLRNAQPAIDRLRREIPLEWRAFADLPFEAAVASSATLSTFHGCPPSEIGRIVEFLLRDVGVPTIVKLNPTLLGYDTARNLLHERLGYTHLRLSREAFDADLQWEQMCALVSGLGDTAHRHGLAFGVKFSNTLVVENEGEFLPRSESKKYMSGPPLHVLAMDLVHRFRGEFGSRFPISFSAGIDAGNFADAVALGLTPITVCTDLLKPSGYARGKRYFKELQQRMTDVGATSVPEFIARAYGAPAGEVTAAQVLHNTAHYVSDLASRPRYSLAANSRAPRKIGSALALFDCITCDKCVPVCPNDANFTIVVPVQEIRSVTAWEDGGAWRFRFDGTLPLLEKHQIATFADACNECGNCDVACPEDGGPYLMKPRFFGSAEAWRDAAPLDGFCVERGPDADVMRGRIAGDEYRLEFTGRHVRYLGCGFALDFDGDNLEATVRGHAVGEVDLTPYALMSALRAAVLDPASPNFVNCLV